MSLAQWININAADIRRAKADGSLSIEPYIGRISGEVFYAICNNGGMIESYDTAEECQERIKQCLK